MNLLTLSVRRLCALALLIIAAATAQGVARAAPVVVTFDDVSTGGLGVGSSPIGSPYAGLNWTCDTCTVVDVPAYTSHYANGYLGALVSGNNVFSTTGSTISLAAGGSFSLDSLTLAAAWRDNLSVTFTGYNGTTAVDSLTLPLGSAGAGVTEALNWSNLTSFNIATSGGTASTIYTASTIASIGIDNLTYEPTPVPLPASAWLLVSALGALGLFMRRKPVASAKLGGFV